MLEKSGGALSVRRQCELLGINRNRLTARRAPGLRAEDLVLARRIDELHLSFPEFGTRRMSQWLRREGRKAATRRTVGRIMRLMGLEAICRRPRTSLPAVGATLYPYLLRGRETSMPDGVCGRDLHSDSAGLRVSGGGDGLGNPRGAGLEAFQHAGRRQAAAPRIQIQHGLQCPGDLPLIYFVASAETEEGRPSFGIGPSTGEARSLRCQTRT